MSILQTITKGILLDSCKMNVSLFESKEHAAKMAKFIKEDMTSEQMYNLVWNPNRDTEYLPQGLLEMVALYAINTELFEMGIITNHPDEAFVEESKGITTKDKYDLLEALISEANPLKVAHDYWKPKVKSQAELMKKSYGKGGQTRELAKKQVKKIGSGIAALKKRIDDAINPTMKQKLILKINEMGKLLKKNKKLAAGIAVGAAAAGAGAYLYNKNKKKASQEAANITIQQISVALKYCTEDTKREEYKNLIEFYTHKL